LTFSIVARSADGNSWGVAVASKFLAVGAYVPAAEAGTGAVATQSYANLAFKKDGLALLRSGQNAKKALDALIGADDLRAERQLGIVDWSGSAATYTGDACNLWAGGVAGEGYAIQGNILTGPGVIHAMQQAWLDSASEEDLGRRLLSGLVAGDDAGGDRRGRQSAALLVVSARSGYGGGNDVLADLRSDDHDAPVTELARLLDLHDLYFRSSRPEDLLPLEEPLLSEVGVLLATVGYTPTAMGPPEVRQALWDWASVENLEERVPQGAVIDPVVLVELKKKAGD
jgi:uncharacterized Ntn-hydrolase superfamily protein